MTLDESDPLSPLSEDDKRMVIVERQAVAFFMINTAINLWFRERDAVSEHLLSATAADVLKGIGKAKGITSHVFNKETEKALGKKPSATAATSPAADAASSPAKKQEALPFHGIISAVAQTAKTFSIAGKEKTRVFRIRDRSVITIAKLKTQHHAGDAPGTMTDVAIGEKASGSFWKNADDSLEVKSVKLDPWRHNK